MQRMSRWFLLAVLAALSACAPLRPAGISEPVEVWEVDGLDSPESVAYDPGMRVLYVSNINGAPTEKNGAGYISRLCMDGRVLDRHWATGLNAPKGMAVVGERLYVADIDQLVVIDTASGEVVGRYPAPGAKFLNDVAVTGEGDVYVSDMFDDAIYQLSFGKFGLWLKDKALQSPNGLYARRGHLVVAAWGERTEGFDTRVSGSLKTVAYEEKRIVDLTPPLGQLDGVEADGRGRYLVSDWMAGKVYLVGPTGDVRLLLELEQGTADIGYVVEDRLLLVPRMLAGKVTAFRLE